MAVNKRLLQGAAAAGGLVPSENFKVVTYTGDGTSSQFIDVGFTPDFVWIKGRNTSDYHNLIDSSRTAGCFLNSNTTGIEDCNSAHAQIQTNGFNAKGNPNASGVNYVAWCWKANGGTTSSNTDGSITSTVQANTDSGFSIVTWTGDGNISTVGHGLSQVPEMVITKGRANLATYNRWSTYHHSLAENHVIYLDLTDASGNAGEDNYFDDSTFSNTVFGVGDDIYGPNVNGTTMVAYCFHSVEGFSKFGSYTGNGSTNGPIVETGFEPAFVMTKQTDDTSNWVIVDNKRSTTNPRDKGLRPNTADSESTVSNNMVVDFLSNGFQLKQTSGSNANNGNFIYMAFAADPDTEAPTLADSFAVQTYSGNGGTQSITGFGFSPSMIWTKGRTVAYDHGLYDSVRGGGSLIYPSLSQAASTVTNGIQSFDADGVTFGANNKSNASDSTYVAWAWKADDNEPTINTEGSIDSVVSANANSGFSIIKYTGTGSAASVGHNLSSTPDAILIKKTSGTEDWYYHSSTQLGSYNKNLRLNTSDAESTSSTIVTGASATVINLGTSSAVNGSGTDYIAYCWHSVTGYSKFGSYTGNGSSSGPTVTTGFQPDFVMIKSSSLDSTAWVIFDSARSPSNSTQLLLQPQSSSAEINVGNAMDFNADNFQLKDTNASRNQNGQTYIYMAFKIN